MKIVFMGTPDFAVPSLERLNASGHTVAAVVTAPDKPGGRGRKIQGSPVKNTALRLGLPLLQPVKLKAPEFIAELKKINPDILIVVAFRILPREVYSIARFGAVNAHASLLPKYRGAAPIHWAVLKGERETGITTFQIEDKVDTGGILLQKKIPISPEDTTGTLYEQLKVLAAETLLETLDGLEKGALKPVRQDHALATPAPKIFPEMAVLDFSESGEHIVNTARAFSPVPGARFFLNKNMIKILKCRFQPQENTNPGKLEHLSKSQFAIHCADGLIIPDEIQTEGKKRMAVRDFLNGFDLSGFGYVDENAG
jgi:methionyl-tRNA formyltransferase